MNLRLTHVRLLVPDVKACHLFYRDVLGFEVLYGDEESVYSSFVAGETILAIFDQSLMAQAVGSSNRPICADCQDRVVVTFAVGDVDETCRELAERGVQFVAGPIDRPGWGIRTAHFRDPAGHLIEIGCELAS